MSDWQPEWREPPPPQRRVAFAEQVEVALRATPGRWAMVRRYARTGSASALQKDLKGRGLEASVRTVAGDEGVKEYEVFAKVPV